MHFKVEILWEETISSKTLWQVWNWVLDTIHHMASVDLDLQFGLYNTSRSSNMEVTIFVEGQINSDP